MTNLLQTNNSKENFAELEEIDETLTDWFSTDCPVLESDFDVFHSFMSSIVCSTLDDLRNENENENEPAKSPFNSCSTVKLLDDMINSRSCGHPLFGIVDDLSFHTQTFSSNGTDPNNTATLFQSVYTRPTANYRRTEKFVDSELLSERTFAKPDCIIDDDIFNSSSWGIEQKELGDFVDDIEAVIAGFCEDINALYTPYPKTVALPRTKIDYQALFESKLAAHPPSIIPVDTSSAKATIPSSTGLAERHSCDQVKVDSNKVKPVTVKKRRKRTYKRPNYDPTNKVYVEPRDEDVLLGRGGRSNHHPGNKKYLLEKEKLQPKYLSCTKEEKTSISQELVDIVHSDGGRFLKKDMNADGKWYIVKDIAARKKASQALRELKTEGIG